MDRESKIAPKRAVHRRTRRLIFALLLMISVFASAFFFLRTESPIKISEAVRSSVDFSIIIPKKIPDGATIPTQPQFDVKRDILTTQLQTATGKDIVISQQAKPMDTDLKQIDAKETFLTNLGEAYVLQGERGRIQIIIDASDSWLFINADEAIGMNVMRQFVNNLALAKD